MNTRFWISATTLLAGCHVAGGLKLSSSLGGTQPGEAAGTPSGAGAVASGPVETGARCTSGKDYFLSPGVANPGQPGSSAPFKVADVTGDGYPDLVVGRPAGVYVNKHDGTFAPLVTSDWPKDVALAYEIVVADLDRDGKPDLVGAGDGANGRFTYMLGNGDGTFQKGVEFEYEGSTNLAMVSGDFNRDGAIDIATTSYPGIKIFLNPGNGKLRGSVSLEGKGVGLVTGDFTGDGKLDLATFDKDNVYLYAGRAGGTFAAPQSIPIRGEEAMRHGLVAADLDGDGRLDIAALGETGYDSAINVLHNNGNGAFTATRYKVDSQGEARALAGGDLNGDGKPDLVVSNRKTLLVFMNDGRGKLRKPMAVAAGWQGSPNAMSGELAIADFKKTGLGSVALVQDGAGAKPLQVMVFHGGCD